MLHCIVELWEELSIPLKVFIRKRVTDEQDAQDILQDVFLKVVTNVDKLIDIKSAYAWIYTITRHTIVDYYRKHERLIECHMLSDELPVTIDDDSSFNRDIASCLKSMVCELPDIYKEAIVLTAFENHTQKEYSEMIGLSVSGAKSRVQRARKMLKDMVLDCCSLEFDQLGNIINYKKKSDRCKYC